MGCFLCVRDFSCLECFVCATFRLREFRVWDVLCVLRFAEGNFCVWDVSWVGSIASFNSNHHCRRHI